MLRRLPFLLAALAILVTAPAVAAAPTLNVFAAASLTAAFPQIDGAEHYSFAGSDVLAAQIRQGAPADVYAAANTSLPDGLYNAGLVEKPVTFATNKLVLIVPKSDPAGIHSVFDLRQPGLKVVIGTPTVPVGSYTRTVLRNLGIAKAVMANVVSQESDVKGVLGKVALGVADAGFVYITDARTVSGQVTTIKLPAWAQPRVRYEMAVVRSTANHAAAVAFVKHVLGPAGRKVLLANGFGVPPKPLAGKKPHR
jgi:molybdate transport system substrate-binding protein